MKKSSSDLTASVARLPDDKRRAFLDSLSANALASMPWLWEVWANPLHQRAPRGDWTTWVILGGRGAGKTRAGAEWIRSRVEGATPLTGGVARRVALVGETLEQARGVMVEGDSGLLASSPPDRRPKLIASQHKLVWPNGAEAFLHSATSYEGLRGPQFDTAWSDELAKWRHGGEAWDMLQFTLRLGNDPRQLVTTTPKDVPVLLEILGEPGTVVSHAGTEANRINLAPGFIERLQARYGGTRMGRQELDGELIRDVEGALWTRAMIDDGRQPAPESFSRIVVAVDPPASSGAKADECGIVVAGVVAEGPPRGWRAWVLADWSCRGLSPKGWAERAVAAYDEFRADRLVAETNQGGNMVEEVVRTVAPHIAFTGVNARLGKRARAEPVAALYEQGRVHHAEPFAELEDQMCSFVAGKGPSPDRLDALVWALTELIIAAPATKEGPRVRML